MSESDSTFEAEPSAPQPGRALVGEWKPPKFWDPFAAIVIGVLAIGAAVVISILTAWGNEGNGLPANPGGSIATGVGIGAAGFFGLMTVNYIARRWPAIAGAANAMGAESALRKGEIGKAAAYGGAAGIAYQQHQAKQNYKTQQAPADGAITTMPQQFVKPFHYRDFEYLPGQFYPVLYESFTLHESQFETPEDYDQYLHWNSDVRRINRDELPVWTDRLTWTS